MVERNTARHKRARTIAENRYSTSIHVVPCREIVHYIGGSHLQIRTADHILELCAVVRSQKVDGQQRHSAIAGVARRLVKVLFLSMSRFASANDDRRLSRRRWGGQKIALQRIATQPGNLDNFTSRGSMFQVVTGADPHVGETGM